MDHLLLPRGAAITDEERPIYIADAYDGGAFLSYPQRSRFSSLYEALFPDGDVPKYSTRFSRNVVTQLEIFLQTWLFFGLLHEVLGDEARADIFLGPVCSNQRTISTAKLSWIAHTWTEKQHRSPNVHKQELSAHLNRCFMRCHLVMTVVTSQQDIDQTIVATISSLAETLQTIVVATLLGQDQPRAIPWAKHDPDALSRRMTQNGWCPTDVGMWQAQMGSFEYVHYLSKIEQPKVDHSHCEGRSCVAYRSGAKTSHRCTNGDCEQVFIDTDAIKGILESGNIALLDIPPTDVASIKVVSSEHHKTYVALSHVWADGLGNPLDNALPRCQLEHIATLVKQLGMDVGHGTLTLWIDTLCCPVPSLRHRLLCIARMREIYTGAAYVLVLDAALSGYHNSFDLDCVEFSMRFAYSGWMQRLWTLQEGVLAERLWIQLKDRAVDLDVIRAQLKSRMGRETLHLPLLKRAYAILRSLRFETNPKHTRTRLSLVSEAVRQRSVSVADDEAICLCTFLDLNHARITQSMPGYRMAEFWRTYGDAKLPLSRHLAFFCGRKLTFSPFRWAPATLLLQDLPYSIKEPSTEAEVAEVTSQGLRARFPACVLTIAPMSRADREHWGTIHEHVHTRFEARADNGDWFSFGLYGDKIGPGDTRLLDAIHSSDGETTVLLERELNKIQLFDVDGIGTCHGLLGTSSTNDQGELLLRSQAPIGFSRTPRSLAMVHEAVWERVQDPQLQALLQPFHKDPFEAPVIPDDPLLCLLPNAAVARAYALAMLAIQGTALPARFGTTIEAQCLEFVHYMFLFCAGRVGQIEQKWHDGQEWYID